VGANDGSYSLRALAIAPSARIIAFEPHPKSYARLQASLETHRNVSLHNVACSDVSGRLELFDYCAHDGSSHASIYPEVFERLHHANSVSHAVPAKTLDETLEAEGVRRISVLKIDAEGHEMRVLRGAERYLRSGSIDCIQLEFNEMNVFSRVFFKDIYDFLPDYKLYRLLPRGMLAIGAYEPLHCELFAYQNIVALRV
jgi:FkbM family methyltransferase